MTKAYLEDLQKTIEEEKLRGDLFEEFLRSTYYDFDCNIDRMFIQFLTNKIYKLMWEK